MYYMNRETKRNIGLFLAAILVTASLEIVMSEYPFVNFGTLVYPAILECWTLTVFRRIKAPAFRSSTWRAGVFMRRIRRDSERTRRAGQCVGAS